MRKPFPLSTSGVFMEPSGPAHEFKAVCHNCYWQGPSRNEISDDWMMTNLRDDATRHKCEDTEWKLFNGDHQEVKHGDRFTDRDGDEWVVGSPVGQPPHKLASSGRIYVNWAKDDDSFSREFFPTVFNCYWRRV